MGYEIKKNLMCIYLSAYVLCEKRKALVTWEGQAEA